jgi:GT2 family glycosyltransferase
MQSREILENGSFKPENLAVGVVTYNRLELLKRVVDSLRKQTVKPDRIFIVNNSSTDGTEEWLNEQQEQFDDMTVIKQANVGSSGGQYTSLKAMFEEGYEWIWIMDDDVMPARDCLEKMTENITKKDIRVPLRYDVEGKRYINDTIELNLTNPFSSIWTRIIDESDFENPVIWAEGVTFEGPLFHRSVIEKIGYPEKPFFIYGDDTEYMIRAQKAGYKSSIIRDARMDRLLPVPADMYKFTWKHFYLIRNIIAIDVLHGTIGVRLIRPWGYMIKWLGRSKSIKDVLTTIKAFISGYFYRSER